MVVLHIADKIKLLNTGESRITDLTIETNIGPLLKLNV